MAGRLTEAPGLTGVNLRNAGCPCVSVDADLTIVV